MNKMVSNWEESDDEWDELDDQEPEVVQETVPPELDARELQEAKQRLVRVASMGLPLDRSGARAVLGCTQYGYSNIDDFLEPLSGSIKRDATAVLHLLKNNRIRVGKFLSPFEKRILNLSDPRCL